MTSHRYMIDILHADDGRLLLQSPLHPDWAPVLETVHFDGVRQGRLPTVMATGEGRVEPIWHPDAGEPRVSAFRAVVPGMYGEIVREVPISYVRDAVQDAGSTLIERGILKAGDAFIYRVHAFPFTAASGNEAPPEDGFCVEKEQQPLPLDEANLDDFTRRAMTIAVQMNGDAPTFVRRHVLEETIAMARAADDVETGGVLIGRLHRDASIPDIFIEVTAQIPAAHAVSSPSRLTYTPETWAAARAAIALRKQGELMLGPWHSHPNFCRLRGCPADRQWHCPATLPQLSAPDVQLITAVANRAFSLALLVSDSIAGWTCSLFGWRLGTVARRQFYTLRDD